MHTANEPPQTLAWLGAPAAGFLRLLDQTRLPGATIYRDCHDAAAVKEAIQTLQVRGAPAIGVAAAYGLVLGVRFALAGGLGLHDAARQVAADLAAARPTAVNLFHALRRMEQAAYALPATGSQSECLAALWSAARQQHDEDIALCAAIADHGAAWVPEAGGVLTHCNTGALATAGIGTALGCLFRAAQLGRRFTVYVDETRPLLQGARLTAWELQQRGLDPILVCDNMAGQLMRQGRIQLVIVGADRIAANGDTANKIGTYGLAVLAKHHGIPFCVAAPSTTFDLTLPDGTAIPIEERAAAEVTHVAGQALAPPGVKVYNPAFDVTPAELITAIITDAGVIQPVEREAIVRSLGAKGC
ncbi:MAG TPA: S-methyl-5-thioribose-1-phosphate isomerase [Gemmatales bacterium]|nr:S-methyl-5-thioribose-1-phosphate isomerase [Gemmatales bacterium]HMP58123.1 S-methyl-5-thioribose-1-phosphate isomerase [Gemmatales bacterium]